MSEPKQITGISSQAGGNSCWVSIALRRVISAISFFPQIEPHVSHRNFGHLPGSTNRVPIVQPRSAEIPTSRCSAIHVFHNIRWANYKGAVFTELHRQASESVISIDFCHIAETDSVRAGLTEVDVRFHSYPHKVLFKGAYDKVGKIKMVAALVGVVIRSPAKVIVLPGYSSVEHWAMLFVAIVRGKRIAVFCDSTIRDRPQGRAKGFFKRLFFARCDAVLAYGKRSAEYVAYYGADKNEIAFPCQCAAFLEREPGDRRLQSRLEGANNKFRILYVGRLSAEKAVSDLIEAFSQFVRKKNAAELVIIGGGPERFRLEEQVTELGLSRNVKIVGPRAHFELINEYQAADVLVLPSRSEPWGLVVNEALHYGCPAIVSDVCGCVPEMVIPGTTGLVFEAGDVASLSKALERSVEELARTKTAKACIDLEARFTPAVAAKTILNKCVELLEKSPSK